MSRVSLCSTLVLCLLVVPIGGAKADGAESKATLNQEKFGGISMGVGLSLTHDLGWNDRVSKAQIVNGVVRVDEERNDIARIMLEMHYFFMPRTSPFGLAPGAFGHGPFVAIQPGKEKIIDAIGLGWMVGFRNYTFDPTGRDTDQHGRKIRFAATSWNFGVGFVVDPTSKILGDGFVANQPPPPGENAVRLKDTSQGGIMFITSFSW